MKILYEYDINKYLAVCKSLWRKMSVNDLLNDHEIRNFINNVFGWTDIILPGGQSVHIMGQDLLVPGGYHGLAAHQDWPSVGGSKDGIIIWIPLTDITIDSYPLEIIPASHLKGMYPLAGKSDAPWEISMNYYNDNDFQKIPASKGDVLFMSYFTVHRSSVGQMQKGFRISISTRWDNALEPTFIDRMFPTAYERQVRRIISDDVSY